MKSSHDIIRGYNADAIPGWPTSGATSLLGTSRVGLPRSGWSRGRGIVVSHSSCWVLREGPCPMSLRSGTPHLQCAHAGRTPTCRHNAVQPPRISESPLSTARFIVACIKRCVGEAMKALIAADPNGVRPLYVDLQHRDTDSFARRRGCQSRDAGRSRRARRRRLAARGQWRASNLRYLRRGHAIHFRGPNVTRSSRTEDRECKTAEARKGIAHDAVHPR